MNFAPAAPANITPAPPAAAASNNATAALASIFGDDDGNEEMEGADDVAASPTMPGGRNTVLYLLKDIIEGGVFGPFEVYVRTVRRQQDGKKIRRAMEPKALADAAEKIASVVAADRPATCPVLRGIVRKEQQADTAVLLRRLQSAEA